MVMHVGWVKLNSANQFLEDVGGQWFADKSVCHGNTYIVRCAHTDLQSQETGEGKNLEHAS